ncbi:hypothetical protein LCGC14_1967560 [marine sediment metagenome]|uniref:Uncharacterized protein n=1 Tax=marine sediment metagenome TaxID=412755 RepID=A0A0F9HR43_9ZZZZ
MGNDGILVSLTEPTESNIGKFTWLQILTDGTRKWYERSDGGWSLVKTEPAPATADHNHGGLNLAHDGAKMEITKLTVVNGIITELEFGV